MISAVVLTKNEENNIERCLNSLLWCDEILVIDDNSTDETITQISNLKSQNQSLKLKIYKRQLNGDFAGQRNYALTKAKGDWVLFVDADEEVNRELEGEIREKIRRNKGIEGYFLKRIDFFMGKWLKYGEIEGLRILRLARKDAGRWERTVDERWRVIGKTEVLKNPLLHYSHPTLDEFLISINERSSMNAEEFFGQGMKITFFELFKPIGKFFVNYFLKLGFLDGVEGFVFAVLMSLHSFMVREKIYLIRKKDI